MDVRLLLPQQENGTDTRATCCMYIQKQSKDGKLKCALIEYTKATTTTTTEKK